MVLKESKPTLAKYKESSTQNILFKACYMVLYSQLHVYIGMPLC